MTEKELTELSNQELLQKRKKIKNGKLINAVIIGITVGIFFYGVVKNGFGLFTFFPLIIAYLIVKNSANDKILENEIQKEQNARNLK